MKILKVKIKDFKAIKDLEKEINGNNILLMGDNGVGKSSFMQFIRIALGEKDNIPQYVAGEGYVIADKDGNQYTFSVKFKDNKPVITVITADGLKDQRKGVLASIVGAMAFNINDFVELSKTTKGQKEQVEIYKSFLQPEEIEELEKLKAHVKVSYEERTELNREIKNKEGAIKEHPLANQVGAGVVFPKTDVDEIMAEFNRANEINQKIKNVENRMVQRKDDCALKKVDLSKKYKQLEELQQDILSIEKTLEDAEKLNKDALEWLVENKPVDIGVVQQKLSSVQKINSTAEQAEALLKEMALVEKLKEESGELTAKIESQSEAIRDAIRDMESPVEGLTFDDECLLYNGIPVSINNLSTSEIIELGIKLKMAENPDLGILFIEHGESLGTQRLQEIMELAAKNNWQIFMEQVERGKKQLQIEIMGE